MIRTLRSYRALLLIVLCQIIALIYVAANTTPGWDEYGHLPSGLWHLQYGDFRPYRVNPPLVRSLAAIPVLLAGGGIAQVPIGNAPGDRQEYGLALEYGRQQGGKLFFYMFLARLTNITWSSLGTCLMWQLAKRLYGDVAAPVSATLWAFSPLVMGFSTTIVADVPTAVCGLWAADRFERWFRQPSWKNSLWLGIACGLAIATKSTWIILPPLLILMSIKKLVASPQMLGQFVVACGIGLLLVHLTYDLSGVLRPLKDFQFVSQTLKGPTNSPWGNRFSENVFGYLPSPLPALYVEGIDLQRRDFELGYPSYLLGQWQDHGWWYYYLVGILVKEPVALWGLIAATTIASAVPRCIGPSKTELFLWIPGVIVLVLVSSQTGFNHHLRYVLPFYPCLYLFAARSLRDATWSMHRTWIAYACLAWFVVSSCLILPRSYAFFSEAIGGSSQGWRYLGDSNLDWGQDLYTMIEWLERNPEKQPVYVLYSIHQYPFEIVGIPVINGDSALTATASIYETKYPTKSGYWIVFSRAYIEPRGRSFQQLEPVEILSPTIRVFRVKDSELNGT